MRITTTIITYAALVVLVALGYLLGDFASKQLNSYLQQRMTGRAA